MSEISRDYIEDSGTNIDHLKASDKESFEHCMNIVLKKMEQCVNYKCDIKYQ